MNCLGGTQSAGVDIENLNKIAIMKYVLKAIYTLSSGLQWSLELHWVGFSSNIWLDSVYASRSLETIVRATYTRKWKG